MGDERIGRFFWLSEFLRSDAAVRHGLDNTPGGDELNNLRNVLAPGMERIRALLGVPVFITSGYRSPAVNDAVGGSPASQHKLGQAADFISPEAGTPRSIARRLAQHQPELHFDQLIYEGAWVHVSFTLVKPRGQVLTATFVGGRVHYAPGVA